MHICSIGRNLNLERTFRDNKIKKKYNLEKPHHTLQKKCLCWMKFPREMLQILQHFRNAKKPIVFFISNFISCYNMLSQYFFYLFLRNNPFTVYATKYNSYNYVDFFCFLGLVDPSFLIIHRGQGHYKRASL